MGRSLPVFAAFVVALAVAVTAALGQNRSTTISVDEIQPGMRGYGLTVFRGTAPERFGVEVIDVLHNFLPDQELILIRTDHPLLDRATTVAGMSGSPIYLDGRLAGAYAYGWSFGKDPVAGVTPIARMIAEMRRPVRPDSFPGANLLPRKNRRATPRPAQHGTFLGMEPHDAIASLANFRDRLPVRRASEPMLQRTATPLMLSGFTERATELLRAELEPFGLVPLQAGGSAQTANGAPPPYVEGGAIGVQLVRGDIDITGIGTVTHVSGQRLAAFGHPMMEAGELGLPTSHARVLHILASEQRSFKISEATQPSGAMIHDRQAAIVVDTGVQAATVPVTVKIRGVADAQRDTWNFEVASHRLLTPFLVFSAIANAVGSTSSDQTYVTFTAHSTVDIEGEGSVEVEDKGFVADGPNGPRMLSRLRLFDLLEAAYNNPFRNSRALRVEVEIALEFTRDVYEVVDASIAADEVDPDSTIQVRIVLRKYGEAEITRVVPVHVPESAAGTKVRLQIEPGNAVNPERPLPRSLRDIVNNVRERFPASTLALSLKMPSRGLRFRGHVVRTLPSSALDVLQMSNQSEGGLPFVTEDRQMVEIGTVLTGSVQLEFKVREMPRPQ